MSSKIELTLNILLHVFILFCILSSLFWLIIRVQAEKAITNEIGNSIRESFEKMKQDFTPREKIIANRLAVSHKSALEYLHRVYSHPDPLTALNNTFLKSLNLLMISFIFISIVTMVTVLKYSCRIDAPVLAILKENLALFVCVGIVEAVFFKYIALKFIPTKPSLIVNVMFDSIKTKLQ
jgi:hypothetical protein